MKKLNDSVTTAIDAVRYSFAFCFRHNKKDTILEVVFRGILILIGYFAIIVTGSLVSGLQTHLLGPKPKSFTVYDFIEGGYFVPVALLVAILFAQIICQKVKSAFSQRRQQILSIQNRREMSEFRASLDIGRLRTKEFDDLEKKIDELPNGPMTRVRFADEVFDIAADTATFFMFGFSMAFAFSWERLEISVNHPVYVAIIVATAMPMLFAELVAIGRSWKLSNDLVPHHKARGVLTRVFYGTTALLQGKMFGQVPHLRPLIIKNLDHVVERYDSLRWSNIRTTLPAYMFAMAGLCSVLIHAVWVTLSTGGDIGSLTVIIGSARILQGSLRDIVLQVASQWNAARGTVMIEKEYFGMRPLIETANPVKPSFVGPPTLRFDRVGFSYPGEQGLVLKSVSLEIKPGSKVVIVGRNGSGKSSLISLLLRHYDPTSGSIYAGDINLKTIPADEWNKYICALLQNYVIMERKIGEEIASSRLGEEIDDEKIQAAIKFAVFQDVIDLDPKGLNSQIGSQYGGREFSGGQEQRLALARVHYRNSPIIIVDEPDAALDPEAGDKVVKNLLAFSDKTVIMVTQHVSRAKLADMIVVMDQGEIVECGKHDELMGLGGQYASMFAKDEERV